MRKAVTSACWGLANQFLASGYQHAHDFEDAVSTVLIHLVDSRPRHVGGRGPVNDGAVRGYLRKALLNRLRDMRRQRAGRREVEGEPDEYGTGGPLEGDLSVSEAHREAKEELDQAQRQLFDEIVPSTNMRERDKVQFRESVATLRDLRDGRKSMGALIATACSENAKEEERKRARNVLDQRFSRALKRLLGQIDWLAGRGNVGSRRADTLRKVVASLRLRQGRDAS